MNTGRSISMDTEVWTAVGNRAEREYGGDVSATIEALCRNALNVVEG